MLLINRKQSKPLVPEIVTPDMAANKKRSMLNLSGFFKKNQTLSATDNSDDHNHLLPTDYTPHSAKLTPSSIIDDANHITIVESYEDRQKHYTHSYQERYTSFTAECISLQNSEMTSHLEDFDFDPQAGPSSATSASDINNLTGSSTSSLTNDGANSSTKKKLRGLLRRASSNHTTTFSHNPHNNHPEIADAVDEEDLDVSDSESDLNFDPKLEESEVDYKIGGYHPVTKGEIYYSQKSIHREYVILRKLGWGHFSTVWLAKSRYNPNLNYQNEDMSPTSDIINTNDYYVAIKFVKSNKNYLEAARDEIRILTALQDPVKNADYLTSEYKEYFENLNHPGYKHVMKLMDDFEVVGPHGKHICMVFEVLGENVLSLIGKYKELYTNINKEITRKSSLAESTSSISSTEVASPTDNIKFSKWDTKLFKKNTKSKLSLGIMKPIKMAPSVSLEEHDIRDMTLDEDMGKKLQSLNSESLLKIIQTSKCCGGIPLNLVRQIVKQMFLAMDYVHHCGVIHTDLKPENILVDIKDINSLIRVVESERSLKNNKSKPGHCRRNTSIVSNTSVTSGSYKKSRTSCLGDCPIRSSKPLSSSISQEVLFKDVSYDEGKKKKWFSTSPTSLSTNPLHAISIKIADLGNATFSHTHFTNQIQTRQYRSPEIILKYKNWGASTDLWSMGCIIFELITGDYLFDPFDGQFFDKDEDHMAQIIELLGEFPSDQYLIDCKLTSKYFKLESSSNKVVLKNINNLKYWGLEKVLIEKYKFDAGDIQVKLISDLLLKCLNFNLNDRWDCNSLLNHPWLRVLNFENYTKEQMDRDLENMKKPQTDVPGYTSTWGDFE